MQIAVLPRMGKGIDLRVRFGRGVRDKPHSMN